MEQLLIQINKSKELSEKFNPSENVLRKGLRLFIDGSFERIQPTVIAVDSSEQGKRYSVIFEKDSQGNDLLIHDCPYMQTVAEDKTGKKICSHIICAELVKRYGHYPNYLAIVAVKSNL